MSLREHLDRLWPSFVALAGTVAVVLGLLYLFGDESGGGTDDAASDQANGSADGAETPATPGPTSTSDPTGDSTGDASPDEPSEEPTDEPTEEGPVTAPPELRLDIGVLNATTVAGLAAGAEERFEEGGWVVTATANYTQGDVTETTIFYPTDDMRESAEAFAAQFPVVTAIEPTPAGTLNTSHPVVILAQDYADATESQ